jgi:hypothetical protein
MLEEQDEKPPPSIRAKDFSPNDHRPDPSLGVPVRWDFVGFGLRQGTMISVLGSLGTALIGWWAWYELRKK